MIIKKLKLKLIKYVNQEIKRSIKEHKLILDFPALRKNTIELNDINELKKIFNWSKEPILLDQEIYSFRNIEDVNNRRIRDAETLATVMKNVNPRIALEIGTAKGISTALMATNAPEAKIYTINIPFEEIIEGNGGDLTTISLKRKEIGIEYRKRKLKNIKQIYANTANWRPNIGKFDVAFIDGCHDARFVFNDTRKIIRHMKSGSFILWHDFNLDYTDKYIWINSVCTGIEKLLNRGLLKGNIFHVKDSWIAVYKI